MSDNPIFAIDSKRHVRIRNREGKEERFVGLLGVCVNPLDETKFEDQYNSIIEELFTKFSLSHTRMVYKSYDVAKLLTKKFESNYKSFLLDFARQILNTEHAKITFFFTELNLKFIEDGMITIYGKYGSSSRRITVEDFINKIAGYYEIICAWKMQQITKIRNATFIVDGMDALYPCKAWDELTERNHIRIQYKGDQISPLLSTSDLLIKFLDEFMKEHYSPLNEKRIESVLNNDGTVSMENIFIKYIGNPDINHIKPTDNYILNFTDLQEHVKRPIIFVGLPNIPGQKDLFEESPMFEEVLKSACGLNGSIRMFHPRRDAKLIGQDAIADYYLPLCDEADKYLEMLKRSKLNVKKFE